MIPVALGPKPQILVDREDEWTYELLGYIESGENVPDSILRRYAHAEIKAAVKGETYEKCAYCESKIAHVAPGDIEHIKPKSKYPDSTYRWENLTYVCNECNRRKGDQYDEDLPPVNPFVDTPSDHLIGLGPMVMARLGSSKGEATIPLVGLNRPALMERRQEAITSIKNLAERVVREESEPLREILRDQLSIEISDDREFALIKRDVLTALGL